jgi:hypothetical protein
MTATVHNHGKATISVDTGGGNTLEILGYTRNGADVTEEGFFIDVPGDENGGDAGDPIDIQYIGEMARVRLEITKLDVAVMNKVMARLNLPASPKVRGTIGTPGYFMFLNGATTRLLINTPTDPQNFLRAVLRAPTQRNMGVRFTMAVLEFDCYKNANGVLYNSVTT